MNYSQNMQLNCSGAAGTTGKVNFRSASCYAVGPHRCRPRPSSSAARAMTAVAERMAVNVDDVELVDSRPIPLSHLAAMAVEGRLQMQPSPAASPLVWNSRKMASSLVVPVIQGKDTPPIMLEASESGSLRALGGTPRLTSLLAFVTGRADVACEHWPSAPVELDARDQAFIRWNGKTFQSLPEDAKQRVRDYLVTCLIVKPKSTA